MEPLIRIAISGEVTRPMVFATRPETTVGRSAGARRRCQYRSVPATGFASSGSPRPDSSRCSAFDLENSSSTDLHHAGAFW